MRPDAPVVRKTFWPQRLATILADVCVGLEDRNDLFGRGYSFIIEHAATCLVENSLRELGVLRKRRTQLVEFGCFERFCRVLALEFLDGGTRKRDGILSDLDEVAIER
jgi:hypothetical protein